MPARSVYLSKPAIENDQICIGGEEHRHLLVARAEKGELLEIFDGNGNVWTAAVESSRRHETVARVKDSRRVPRDPVELILGLALIRTTAVELALEKAVEVGVARIVPFTADRSNVNSTAVV